MVSHPEESGAPDPDLDATDEYRPVDPTVPPAGEPIPVTADGPAAARKPAAVQKVSVLGDFRLVAVLGSGAMGTVYRARQISTPRDAAVKVLSRDLAGQPDFVQRFHREARLMARLDHPHIIRCYAVGESHGFHYLALEYASGGSVQSWLERLGRFDLPDALCVALGCARGLQYAHEHRLVHRDVKPDNLLFTTAGVIKVADLGLARSTHDDVSLTRTGIALGTPLYAAPEQCRDARHADARCDLYALGGVLYHLLAGRTPFEANNFLELIKAKERGVFTPLRRHRPDVPEAIERLVGRLLARLPEQRVQDCGELIDDLTWQEPIRDVPSFFWEGKSCGTQRST
jgi:serine/threonine-protein kinase